MAQDDSNECAKQSCVAHSAHAGFAACSQNGLCRCSNFRRARSQIRDVMKYRYSPYALRELADADAAEST